MPLWLSGLARIETGGWLGVSSNRIAPCLKMRVSHPMINSFLGSEREETHLLKILPHVSITTTTAMKATAKKTTSMSLRSRDDRFWWHGMLR